MAFDFKKLMKRPKLPTKVMLTIRIVIGLYLYYIVYDLREVLFAPEKDYFLITALVLFIVLGGITIIFSAKDLLQGKYLGGPLDKDADNIDETDSQSEDSVTSDYEGTEATTSPEEKG